MKLRWITFSHCQRIIDSDLIEKLSASRLPDKPDRLIFIKNTNEGLAMCGICGYVSTRGKKADSNTVRRMLTSIHHRGPDGAGIYIGNEAVLGHARLAIIDLETGTQPMTNEDESLWLSFNGEIYNYLEIRNELISLGHRFRTSSDSEVILHSWEQWGPASLSRFNGQWGFAIWDCHNNNLILSVDPYGIRPVFYSIDTDRLVFASEIKALFQDPHTPRELDPGGLLDVYTTWGLAGKRTCFSRVSRVMPGSYLKFCNGQITEMSYRSYELTTPYEGVPSNSDEFIKEKLLDAVNLRFTRSDVPVGAYLSGGLDSSILISLIAGHTSTQLETFSIRFGDDEYNENSYQHELSRELGTNHQSIYVDGMEMMKVFPDVIYHTEQPILRTAPIPMFLLSGLVRENGYKVVVTGEGADEFFAGYDIFRETALRDLILRGAPDTEIDDLLNHLYPWMVRSPGETKGMGRSFFERNLEHGDPFMSHRTRWDNGLALVSMLNPDFLSNDAIISDIDLPDEFLQWTALFKAQWLEIRTLLNGYLLSAQGDRMLMAHSVEGRFPFLDPNVTTFSNGLPDVEKLSLEYSEKAILKRVFRNMLPESILTRPKQPYRAPDAAALFAGRALPWMDELMSDKYIKDTGLFRPGVLHKLFQKCWRQSGRGMSNRDNMMAVASVSTLLLYEKFIKQNPECRESDPVVVNRPAQSSMAES